MSDNSREKASFKIYCPSCRQKLDAGSLPPFTQVNCPVCGAAFAVPKPFDSYLLEEEIGEGGMATVYRALDTALNRRVAIKILHSGLGDELNLRFLAEAKMAAKVLHPAVVSIYTCAIHEGQPYIVMEYMDGITLEKVLQTSEKTDIMQVCEWISDLAGGLERAEKSGIIHHDIKPANMLLDRDNHVKLGDFGIAGTLEQDQEKAPRRMWGSPHYISPEKALTGIEDHAGDIYSLGASFYHLLTMEVPFSNVKELQELLTCRAHRDPVAPHLIRNEIPEELSLFVLKMMHRVPAMRPSYHQIRIFLLDFIRKNSGIRKRVTAGGAALIPERGSSSSSVGSSRGSSSSRRSENPPLSPSSAGVKGSCGEEMRLQEKPIAGERTSPPPARNHLRLLTALGKLVLFLLFFLFVFGISRYIMNQEEEKKEGSRKNETLVAEEKKK